MVFSASYLPLVDSIRIQIVLPFDPDLFPIDLTPLVVVDRRILEFADDYELYIRESEIH